jgi:hypothetical protein
MGWPRTGWIICTSAVEGEEGAGKQFSRRVCERKGEIKGFSLIHVCKVEAMLENEEDSSVSLCQLLVFAQRILRCAVFQTVCIFQAAWTVLPHLRSCVCGVAADRVVAPRVK